MGDFIVNPNTSPNVHSDIRFLSKINGEINDSTKESKRPSGKCHFHYFHFIVKTGYYAGIIPFKLTFNPDIGHYQLSRPAFIRKVIFMMLLMFPAIRTPSHLRLTWEGSKTLHPVFFYFRLVSRHVYVIFPLLYYKVIYSNFEQMERMLEAVSHSSLLQQPDKYKAFKWILVVISQLGWPMLVIVVVVFGQTNWTPQVFYNNFLAVGIRELFLNDMLPSYNGTTPRSTGSQTADIFIAIFGVTATIISRTLSTTMVVSLGVTALTIWVATTNFVDDLKHGSLADDEQKVGKQFAIRQLRDKYIELWDLANELNTMWSGFCFHSLLSTFLWLCIDLNAILKSKNYAFKVWNTVMLTYLSGSVVLSAESSKKNRWFGRYLLTIKRSLRDSGDFDTERIIDALIQQVQYSTVCVGQGNFFEVDYSFVFQVLVALVTFFIVTIEFGEQWTR